MLVDNGYLCHNVFVYVPSEVLAFQSHGWCNMGGGGGGEGTMSVCVPVLMSTCMYVDTC